MAELTFYPDADPELTSVDGFAYRSLTPGETWANILAGAGIYAIDDSSPLYCPYMRSYTSTDKWRTNGRAPLLFDTSLLLPSYSLKSAQLKIYVGELRDDAGWKPDLVCVSSNPASNTAVIPADYQAFGSIPLSSVLAYDSIVLKTYNVLQLNAAGLAAIVKGGITKLGLRNSNYDISGSAPLWASDKRSWFAILTADYVEGSPPALVVTYQQIVVPTVTTNPATDIKATSATLKGTLVDDGGEACDCNFEWGETDAYEHGATSPQSKTTGEDFSQAITGLLPNRTYHFRAKVTNSAGTGYGDDRAFKTTALGSPIVDQLIYQHAERMAR
ncbi:hypothetical protein ES703_67488 [subsurface metagenome]